MHTQLSVYDQESLIQAMHEAFQQVADFTAAIDEEAFFAPQGEKWSIAANLEHLMISADPVAKALALPGLVLRKFGKPNRPSRTYIELVKRYQERLAMGGQATSRYIPEVKTANKTAMLDRWKAIEHRLTKRMKKWDEKKMDNYIVPHPLLGKLLIREVLFFTIFHTYHHLKTMERLGEGSKL